MTDDERTLLVALNRWRRREARRLGSDFPPRAGYGYDTPDRSWRVDPPQNENDTMDVRRRYPSGRLPMFATPYPVPTVTVAVDLLAALGILPKRFSSAYRAGVLAGAVATTESIPEFVKHAVGGMTL